MKRRYCIFAVIGMVLLTANCVQKKKDKVDRNGIENGYEILKIKLAKDTIAIDEPLKCFIHLKKPFFKDKNSEIMVFLNYDEKETLKKDLSNEYDIPVKVFVHLALDSVNKKWFTGYPNYKTAAFGRTFSSPGKKKIQGYVLEYYDQDPHALVDSIPEDVEIKRYYFERDIYVTDRVSN